MQIMQLRIGLVISLARRQLAQTTERVSVFINPEFMFTLIHWIHNFDTRSLSRKSFGAVAQ